MQKPWVKKNDLEEEDYIRKYLLCRSDHHIIFTLKYIIKYFLHDMKNLHQDITIK